MLASVIQQSRMMENQVRSLQAVLTLMLRDRGGSFTFENARMESLDMPPIVMDPGKISTTVKLEYPKPKLVT